MVVVTSVKVTDPAKRTLRLRFSDGLVGDVPVPTSDLRGPVLDPLRDPKYFQLAKLSRKFGTVVWPNGADLSPDYLYELALSSVQKSRPKKTLA